MPKVHLYSELDTLDGDERFYAVDDPAGTPADGYVTSQTLAEYTSSIASASVEFMMAVSDEATAISTTGEKLTFRAPYAFTLTGVRASLSSAAATGTFTVDVNETGVSVLSTKLTIDATELTSTTATTPAVISDTAIADDAEITIDVDNTGDDTATGLKLTLYGTRTF